MNKLKVSNSMFEDIKHTDEFGREYWLARELQKVLDYKLWQNFKKVIDKAILSCKNSNYEYKEQFIDVNNPLKGGNGAIQMVQDYKLSRYACYLIAQNGDSRKRVIA